MNQGIPQWQKVKSWYQIRIVLNGRWDTGCFKNPQELRVAQIFLRLKVTYIFVIQKSNHPYFHILHHFIDDLKHM